MGRGGCDFRSFWAKRRSPGAPDQNFNVSLRKNWYSGSPGGPKVRKRRKSALFRTFLTFGPFWGAKTTVKHSTFSPRPPRSEKVRKSALFALLHFYWFWLPKHQLFLRENVDFQKVRFSTFLKKYFSQKCYQKFHF